MLLIDPTSHVPPFEQVRAQLAELVRSGTLAPGDRLPTVRRLAGDLGLATNTVARAYRELEQAGIVQTRGRHGTFVATRGQDRDREARAAAFEYVRRATDLGLSPEDAVALVRAALAGRSGRAG